VAKFKNCQESSLSHRNKKLNLKKKDCTSGGRVSYKLGAKWPAPIQMNAGQRNTIGFEYNGPARSLSWGASVGAKPEEDLTRKKVNRIHGEAEVVLKNLHSELQGQMKRNYTWRKGKKNPWSRLTTGKKRELNLRRAVMTTNKRQGC